MPGDPEENQWPSLWQRLLRTLVTEDGFSLSEILFGYFIGNIQRGKGMSSDVSDMSLV